MRHPGIALAALLTPWLVIPLEAQSTDSRVSMLTCALVAVQGEGLDTSPLDLDRVRFAAARFRYSSPDAARIDALIVEIVQDSVGAPYHLKFTEGMVRRDGWVARTHYNLLPGTSMDTRRAIKVARARCDPPT